MSLNRVSSGCSITCRAILTRDITGSGRFKKRYGTWEKNLTPPFVLEKELWNYYVERSAVARLSEAVQIEGLQRTSMKNLAELLMRLWMEPRPKERNSPDAL